MDNTTNDELAVYDTIINISGRNYRMDRERIAFLDSRFYRDREDASLFVPSVTTVLEAYPKGAQYYDWLKRNGADADEIRDDAGRRGSVVHQLTELYDQGEVIQLMDHDGSPRYKLIEWAMFERYVEFCEAFPARLHAVEFNMASAKVGYGGTLDRVLTLEQDGITRIVDIKTSGGVWPSYWLQQAAYHNLLFTTGAAERALAPGVRREDVRLSILWLNAKTRGPRKDAVQGKGWQLIDQPETTEHYLDLFDKTRALWLAENAGQMPKEISYQLQHQRKVGALGWEEQQVTDANKQQ